MSTEYFDNLEEQLVAASRRLSNEHIARRRRRWMGRRPILVALVALMCATAAFAVSDQAPWSPVELTLRENPEQVPVLSGAAVPGSLDEHFAVLRRPQTAADRGPTTREALKDFSAPPTGIGPRYGIRANDIRTNGIRTVFPSDPLAPTLVIVPVDVDTFGGTETQLRVWVRDPVPGAGSGLASATAESLKRPSVTGSIGDYVYGFAPDGVVRVRLQWPDAAPVVRNVVDNTFTARSPEGVLLFPKVTWLNEQDEVVPAQG